MTKEYITIEECEDVLGGHFWQEAVNVCGDEPLMECTQCKMLTGDSRRYESKYYPKSEKDIINNPIIQLLLSDIPAGSSNNCLWFPFKCLWRDCCITEGYNYNCDEFRKIHSMIERKQRGNYPTNVPGPDYQFNPITVNRWCARNKFPVIYNLKHLNQVPKRVYPNGKPTEWVYVARRQRCKR